jgi:cytochrome oxidase assembly protein ShyY1
MTNAPPSTIAALPSSRRAWPARVGLSALTAAGVALFVLAGNWQRDRMHAKQELRERYDAASMAQPVAMPDPGADWAPLRYQPVVAHGEFDASRQILIDNRVHDGQVGYDVVAPLMLDDGRRVLVKRGWIAQLASRATLPDVAPPAGHVELRGRINIPSGGYFELSSTPSHGVVWQHLDPRRFSQVTGVAVLPAVIEQTVAANQGDMLVRDWPAPDFGVEQHRIYMAQWYAFAALAMALWLYFATRALTRRSNEARDG